MSITVTVNGQSGPAIAVKSGDQVGVSVGASSSSYTVGVSAAGTPGGQGIQGPAGPPATTITVGNVSTLAAGSNATVTATSSNSGANLTLAFGLPQGQPGQTGPAGSNGTTPTLSIGNVTTLASTENATVTATTTNNGANVALSFGLPRGQDGNGTSNLTLSSSTPSALGTAAAGSSNQAARGDHVHELPNLTTLGAAAANHAHNYVTSLNNLTGGLSLVAGANVSLTANGSTLTIAASGGLGENDAVDGGNYVGEILYGITFTTQPQSQTVSTGAFTVSNVTMPTGTYAAISFANGSYFATPSNADSGGDYLAKSQNGISWTRQNGAFATASPYQPVQFGGGLYLTLQNTTGSGQKYATSSDGVTWTERTPPFVFRDVKHIAGLGWVGHYVASTYSRFQVSTDGVTWANLYNGSAFQTEAVSFALIAGKFVVNGVAATISGGSIGSFGTSPSGLSGSLVAASSTAAVYAGGGQLHVVDWAAESVTLTATFAAPYSAAFHSPSGRWLIVNESGVFTTPGTSTPVLRLSFTGGTAQNQSRVYVSSGGRATVLRATGGSAEYELSSSDDGGLTWNSRQTSTLPGGTPLGTAAGDLVVLLPPSLGVSSSQIRVVTPGGTTASASFTVAATATSGNPVSYQWQNSVDAGTSWGNVANATANTLALTALTTSDNGTRYRAVASATGATPTPSQSATLTVTG